MKSYFTGFLFVAVFLMSCADRSVKTIEREKAALIFSDIALADQVINLHDPLDRDSIREVLIESLLKIHDISRSELDTNLYLYMSDLNEFGPLSDRMVKRFESLLNSAEE